MDRHRRLTHANPNMISESTAIFFLAIFFLNRDHRLGANPISLEDIYAHVARKLVTT